LQNILQAHDNYTSSPLEISKDVAKEEVPEEEESSPNIFGHFFDSIFQANFETVHPYNTKSKTQKNIESNEIPIAFLRSDFKGVEINYPIVYQHAYAIFKAVNTSGHTC
jgi:hypothetical protein